VLARDPNQVESLKGSMKHDNVAAKYLWEKPPNAPEALPLYLLVHGNFEELAAKLSCVQEIAGDGCFSLGMLADFQETLEVEGPHAYRRLFWEAGLIGQVLYLEAEGQGVRGTGVGCFFDDSSAPGIRLAGSFLPESLPLHRRRSGGRQTSADTEDLRD